MAARLPVDKRDFDVEHVRALEHLQRDSEPLFP